MRKLAVLLLLAGGRGAWAQDGPPKPPAPEPVREEAPTGKDHVKLAFNFYNQADGGGNKNLKEDMVVLEPMVLVSKALDPKWSLNLKLQSDIITAASVDKDYRFLPGHQSGASGDKYWSVEAGAFYAWAEQVSVGFGFSFANEYDYHSVGINGRVAYETPSRNDTFVFKLSLFNDTLDLIRFTGLSEGEDGRRSISPGFGWTRVLGPRTIGTFNYDLTLQSGYLQTPYNSVFLGGTEFTEELPDSRSRHNLFARVRHLLAEDFAVEPGLGLYFDDWGASAVNVELRGAWEAIPGMLILEPKYRFHSQKEVKHFLDEGAAVLPEFRTQDSDLATFTSHTFGIMADILRASFLGEGMEMNLGFDYTFRSDGLDAFSLTMGYTWRF